MKRPTAVVIILVAIAAGACQNIHSPTTADPLMVSAGQARSVTDAPDVASPEPAAAVVTASSVITPCSAKRFETILISRACRAGGQAAERAMVEFVKYAKKTNPSLVCPECHSKVSGSYALKPNGLKLFYDNGGT